MGKNVCRQCSAENEAGVRYCQRCGGALEEKLPLFSASNLRWLAGMGRKDVNFAPLVASEGREQAPVRPKVSPLPDGSCYCPECGTNNAPRSIFCSGCGRDM